MPFLLMRFGSLFSGIGGLDLGLERAGLTCSWQSEIDPYCSRVLNKHWPAVPNLGDIKNIDWTTTPAVDLVCGGYPCQPFSNAGSRKGTNDERHLWPYFADCVRILRPRFALLENVPGHLSLGFGQVLGDLAALGYNTEWDCIPAAAVGAPHRRDRLFVIATRTPMANTNSTHGKRECKPVRRPTQRTNAHISSVRGSNWTSQPGVDRVVDGIPNRVDRLRGLGNAVVPQVAEHIGNIIKDMAQ